MKTKHIFFCLAIFFSFNSLLNATPLSVVIIGGGPAGLSAAIQARLLGSDVTIIEKRRCYTRQNILFLHESSLNLLERWNIEVENMLALDLKGQRRGFALIKHLEDALFQKTKELGITFIEGAFEGFVENEKALVISTAEGNLSIFYDVAIGADGIHSNVREILGITVSSLGKAIGVMAIIPGNHSPGKVEVERKDTDDFFAKNIQTPSMNIILMQNRPEISIGELSQKELIDLCLRANWNEEASLLHQNTILLIDNIPIYLQQASRFSDQNKNLLLLGDAAGCTSFFDGQGVNTALATSEFISDFIKIFEANPELAHLNFDIMMEETIGSVVQKNQHLFHCESID